MILGDKKRNNNSLNVMGIRVSQIPKKSANINNLYTATTTCLEFRSAATGLHRNEFYLIGKKYIYILCGAIYMSYVELSFDVVVSRKDMKIREFHFSGMLFIR